MNFHSELKKRIKQRENENKKKIKEEEKKKKAEAAPKEEKKSNKKVEEELDPSKYTDNRKNFIQSQRDKGLNPYPHKFSRTHRIDHFRHAYEQRPIENGQFLEDETVAVTGRVLVIRE